MAFVIWGSASGKTSYRIMMTSSNGKIFRVTGPLCGEYTGHRWIPLTKASNAEIWCVLISAWTHGWLNNRDAGDLKRHGAHYDVTVMWYRKVSKVFKCSCHIGICKARAKFKSASNTKERSNVSRFCELTVRRVTVVKFESDKRTQRILFKSCEKGVILPWF